MILMKYMYFAKFAKNTQSQYEVEFPDFTPAVATYGDNLQEALHMAHDALEGYLLVAEDSHDAVPAPKNAEEISVTPHVLLIPIEVDTTLAREREENKLVKKTLTIPAYLNTLGKERGVNFSATLTTALKEKLER
ncbi:toxin-antitoxin system, antitoxin component, HicB family [Schleiferilactobacillus perolens DSM 12744]|uniref:Toxin-antitoxin system, antitoxin component, HicB family n=2 Tax=Schleiferilactobacillus perolens TaxID=100468 RepID=A0A0R1MU79_9LACO|nr:toxin-antitoxin system, antitoxin component, HicB family [Schleiferilactobacillus perolens DSM 12744]